MFVLLNPLELQKHNLYERCLEVLILELYMRKIIPIYVTSCVVIRKRN